MNAKVENNEVKAVLVDDKVIRQEMSQVERSAHIIAEVSEIVDSLTAVRAKRGEANAIKTLDKVRALAVEVADNGLNTAKVADLLHNAMITAKIAKGTADPYRDAFKGYVKAVKEGTPIESG
ncbi:MAG TPA: hypothetical protein V6D20_23520, partial [Candidatus Obscuribacterales bacterium]